MDLSVLNIVSRESATEPTGGTALATEAHDSRLLSYLSLFTSFGTVLCCALPSLLVLLGLGATVASVVSAVPGLITLSLYKSWVFAVSGVLIGGNFMYVYVLAPRLKTAGEACSIESPGHPTGCDTASRLSRVLLWVSAGLYAAGFFVAYLLLPIVLFFENIIA